LTASVTRTPTVTPTLTQTQLNYTDDSIYNLLSATGQTAYRNAVFDNFLEVSETDYVTVLNNLTDATNYGPSISEFTGTTNSQWGPVNFLSDSTQTGITSNSYIVGFAMRSSRTSESYTCNVYQTTGTVSGGTYTAITNNITFTNTVTNAKHYFIRKSPQTFMNSTTYLGLFSTNNVTQLDLSTRLQYYSGSPAGTPPFSTLTTRPPAFIVMTTLTKTW